MDEDFLDDSFVEKDLDLPDEIETDICFPEDDIFDDISLQNSEESYGLPDEVEDDGCSDTFFDLLDEEERKSLED